MARYTRMEIHKLCQRLEARANSVVNAQPSFAGDMRAAAMLLKLMLALADIQVVETSPRADQRWTESVPSDGRG